jgi:Fe2+ transport system protein FeoA
MDSVAQPTGEHDNTVSLWDAPEGRRFRIMDVAAGRGLRARLTAMGLSMGLEGRVVRDGRRGPFVVACGDKRVILGKGMAQQLRVELLSG